MRLGLGVYRPVSDGERYDLIFDLRPCLMRVQCKWAPLHGDVIVLRCYSSRRNGDGLVRRVYQADELDAYAVYCPDTDRCYFVRVDECSAHTQLLLRVSPARNNQLQGINWAKDFEFAAKLGCLGP
jgi:hypothetical protein